MKISLILFFILASIANIANAQINPGKTSKMNQVNSKSSKHKIILKFDDLIASDANINACSLAFDYCVEHNIKAGWGVFNMGTLTEVQKQRLQKYLNSVNDKGEKLFELWHHGLDHSKDKPLGTQEFKGTGYDNQKAHFEQADQIVLKQLGIQMHTFGAPYNASDSVTGRVISENINYNVVLYGSFDTGLSQHLINLNQRVNIESATGVIEYNCFIADYNRKKDKLSGVMVLQGHPAHWGAERILELDKIVKFLQGEGYEFVLPYEYYLSTL